MKKLTVMVSIYESGQFIENRLENLMQCDCLNDIEIWCVNANSPDEKDDTIPQKFPVNYIKLDRRISVYETWNYIIEKSQGQFITNGNTDDIVAPNCYSRLMAHLDIHDFAYCSWYSTHIPNQQWNSMTYIDPGGRPGYFNGDINAGGVGHFPVWRRSLHEKLGGFDTDFQALADAEWWARCFYVGKAKFIWVNELLGCYLWRDGQNLWHRMVTPQEWELFHQKVMGYKN
jgi:hypothetical protein